MAKLASESVKPKRSTNSLGAVLLVPISKPAVQATAIKQSSTYGLRSMRKQAAISVDDADTLFGVAGAGHADAIVALKAL